MGRFRTNGGVADLTPERIALIRKYRLEQGLPVPEVARLVGVGKSTVSVYASTKQPAHWDEVLTLARQGLTQGQIWCTLGVGQVQVSTIIRRAAALGIIQRPSLAVAAGGSYEPVQVPKPTPEPTAQAEPEAPSLKEKILKQVLAGGPYGTLDNLLDAMRNGSRVNYGSHEVTHLLFSLDGTVRVRDGSYVVDKDDLNDAEIEEPITGRYADVDEETWERLHDAVNEIRDGEIPAWDGWPEHRPPVLDGEAKA